MEIFFRMKTFLIEKPEAFSFGETKMPEVKAGEVLLKIERVGLCGSDLTTFRGLNPLVTYPRIPGHEIAATIAEVSAGVPAHLKPGLLVTVVPYTTCGKCPSCRAKRPNACQFNQTFGVQRDGALTEFISVPWQKILHSPKLTAQDYALVEPLSVGFHAVERGRVTAANTVAVFGAGMIGLGAIAGAALRKKARVIAIDLDDQKLALAKKAGAAEVINSKSENLHERLQQLTNGEGPGVVIEAVGAAETFVAAVNEVCFTGRVVYIGYAKKPVAYETKFFVMKELDILGSRNALPEDFENVIRVLESGLYPVAETVTRVVPFAQAGEALQDWSVNPTTTTKIHIHLH
jgi:threonine dehydrogenase-like Zn-dependent dehydrogenase